MKRLLTMLMVCVMTVSLFAACGRDDSAAPAADSSKETQSNKENKDTKESNDTAASAEAKAEPLSFSISMRTLNKAYINESPDINEDKWVMELERRANVDLDITLMDHSKFNEQMNLMFAGGDIPDVVQSYEVTHPSLAGAVDAGVFMPIGDLIQENKDRYPNLNSQITDLAWEEVRSEADGKIYAVPEYLSIPVRRGTYIRKDLLDSLGLEIPETLDEYVEVMKAFRDAGVKYPYSGREKFKYSGSFFGAFNAAPNTWVVGDDGMLRPAAVTENMKDALAFHRMLVEEGLMDEETLTNKGSDWAGKIHRGEVGIFTHNANSIAGWNAKLKETNPDYELILAPSPVGPEGNSGLFKYPSALRCYYINANVENPFEILDYFEWFLTDEAKEFLAFGIEGENYTKDGDKVIFEYPTDDKGSKEIDYRTNWLAMVQDASYNELLLPYMPYGDQLENFFSNIAVNEGIDNFDPGVFETRDDLAELSPAGDGAPELWGGYAAKIFFGQESVDYFDEYVAEFNKRGGDKLIQEATDRHNEGLSKARR